MGFGVNISLAPGVSLRATSHGVRARVGPGAALLPAGPERIGFSAGAGLPPSAEQAESVDAVLELERSLTTRHLGDFPVSHLAIAAPPQPVDVDRIEQVFRRQALADVGWFARGPRRAARIEARMAAVSVANQRHSRALDEAEHRQSEYHASWNALRAYDPLTVIGAVDAAFADNAPGSTCTDAGFDPQSGRYVSCVVTFGHPDLVPAHMVATTPRGQLTLRTRSQTEVNDLYVAAMASTVLATVREAFAVAPSADEVRIVVVRAGRADPPSVHPGLSAIYAGAFHRPRLEALDWPTVDPEAAVLSADGAEFLRTGSAQTVAALEADTQRRMAAILQAFADPEGEEGDWV